MAYRKSRLTIKREAKPRALRKQAPAGEASLTALASGTTASFR